VKKTRKQRSDSFSQKTHDNASASVACLRWEVIKKVPLD